MPYRMEIEFNLGIIFDKVLSYKNVSVGRLLHLCGY